MADLSPDVVKAAPELFSSTSIRESRILRPASPSSSHVRNLGLAFFFCDGNLAQQFFTLVDSLHAASLPGRSKRNDRILEWPNEGLG